jgi:predicted GNAT family acetyltransferase
MNASHSILIDEFDAKLNLLPGQIFAVFVDNHIASACVSSREDERAAEAWVQTSETFRRRGYASQVTAAWADNLQRQGKIPFYSHRSANKALEGVARKLDLVRFIDDVAYI